MNRYKQALGSIKMKVDGLDFVLAPVHGDNTDFLDLQEKNEGKSGQMFKDFTKFAVKILNRGDNFDTSSDDYQDLSIFVEINVSEFFKEFMIAFRHTTRDKWDAQEKMQLEGFQTESKNK